MRFRVLLKVDKDQRKIILQLRDSLMKLLKLMIKLKKSKDCLPKLITYDMKVYIEN